ncbi:MAG: CoA transferase [Candidatus Binatia bacterium]|nr:CoA transferase [Candidatus Binatia bacterium]
MGLRDLIEGYLAGYTTKEILQRIGDTGIPHSPVNDFAQLILDPHVQACGLIQDWTYHDWRITKQLPSPHENRGGQTRRQDPSAPTG